MKGLSVGSKNKIFKEGAMDIKPKVSVCIITYNHEKYIAQCLGSVLNQKVDFDFEVIVGDDHSTDGTREILQEFKDNYPDRVKLLLHKNNSGAFLNYSLVHKAAEGEYIAHMDGDDWMLPGKLQLQSDFLDIHSECSFVTHRVDVVNDNGSKVLRQHPSGHVAQFKSVNNLVRNYIYFNHSSKMYRCDLRDVEFVAGETKIDFQFHIENAITGKIGFLPQTLGCHRKHNESETAAKGASLRRRIDKTLDAFECARTLGVEREDVDYGKSRYLVGAGISCLECGDSEGLYHYFSLSRVGGKYISLSHRIIYGFRRFPKLLMLLNNLRKRVVAIKRRYSYIK